MSKQVRITKRVVDSLQPGTTLWDADISGFGVRCQKRDKVYVLKARVGGRQRWFTVGKHGSPWTPETARKKALALLGVIAAGNDPATVDAAQTREAMTLRELAEEFTRAHIDLKRKETTGGLYKDLITRLIVPALGRKRVTDIKPDDVHAFHAGLKDTPYQANRTLAVLSKMMSFAEERGLRAEGSNPCRRVERFREQARDRFLTNPELLRLGEALDAAAEQNPYSTSAIRLLLATGARLSEILTLKWEYIDLQRALLFLPDGKAGRRAVPLNANAVEVLRQIPKIVGNPFVIVGKNPGARLVNLQKAWRRVRSAAGLPDVRLHDLRHTFASLAAASGASLPIIGRLLGHNHPATTQRYAHLANDPVRAVGELVGASIDSAFRGSK